jgi:hypothetical protein
LGYCKVSAGPAVVLRNGRQESHSSPGWRCQSQAAARCAPGRSSACHKLDVILGEGLHHLGLGARVARKGWLRKQDVLNTRPLAEVEAFLKTPKSKR